MLVASLFWSCLRNVDSKIFVTMLFEVNLYFGFVILVENIEEPRAHPTHIIKYHTSSKIQKCKPLYLGRVSKERPVSN